MLCGEGTNMMFNADMQIVDTDETQGLTYSCTPRESYSVLST
jgi:hypothetical protein